MAKTPRSFMEKRLSPSKNIAITTLILGLIGSLTTYFLLQEETKSTNPSKKVKREITIGKKALLPLKTKKNTDKPLSKGLYVPPETFIGIQKLNFESIKSEIKAEKEKKKTYKNNDYKRKEENHKNVFLSLLNIK